MVFLKKRQFLLVIGISIFFMNCIFGNNFFYSNTQSDEEDKHKCFGSCYRNTFLKTIKKSIELQSTPDYYDMFYSDVILDEIKSNTYSEEIKEYFGRKEFSDSDLKENIRTVFDIVIQDDILRKKQQVVENIRNITQETDLSNVLTYMVEYKLNKDLSRKKSWTKCTNASFTYDTYVNEMQRFQEDLVNDNSDVVLIAIGTGGQKSQVLPSYFKNLFSQNKNLSFKIFTIEQGKISRENLVEDRYIDVKYYQTKIPKNKDHLFYKTLETYIRKQTNNKKLVFIGNYTTVKSFSDIPGISDLCVKLKRDDRLVNHENLQFYTTMYSPYSPYGSNNPWYLFFKTDSSDLKVLPTLINEGEDSIDVKTTGVDLFIFDPSLRQPIPYVKWKNIKFNISVSPNNEISINSINESSN